MKACGNPYVKLKLFERRPREYMGFEKRCEFQNYTTFCEYVLNTHINLLFKV